MLLKRLFNINLKEYVLVSYTGDVCGIMDGYGVCSNGGFCTEKWYYGPRCRSVLL